MSKVKNELLKIETLVDNLEALQGGVESITLKAKNGKHILIPCSDDNTVVSVAYAIESIKQTRRDLIKKVSQYMEIAK